MNATVRSTDRQAVIRLENGAKLQTASTNARLFQVHRADGTLAYEGFHFMRALKIAMVAVTMTGCVAELNKPEVLPAGALVVNLPPCPAGTHQLYVDHEAARRVCERDR